MLKLCAFLVARVCIQFKLLFICVVI
uniref:Uncharacterized protein n=1 Tax=Arundo donax TaxID=35708 RepID=A0A0A8YI31_ARUDO